MIKVRGTSGFLEDLEPEDLPLNAITAGQNFTIEDGYAASARGHEAVWSTPSLSPYWCIQHIDAGATYWIYTGLLKAYRVNSSGTHTNITRQITTSITSASVANPTVITATAHGIADGDTVVISGDTTATPTINGTHVATVLTDDTFTIPVNVTVAGSDGQVVGDENYTGTAADIWNGCVLGTIPIVNNGVDVPQQWDSSLVKLKDLSNWTSTHRCKTIRAFKNYLIAMNITKSSTQYPQMVKWSHGAEPLAVPGSWDETDPTQDAGENNLLSSTGEVIDGGQLRDVFIVYKEDSTHLMRHIGGQFVFSFQELFKTSGILTVNCWQEYKGMHYVLTRGDIIAHDGSSIYPISTRRVRNYLFDDLDPDNYIRAFVALNPAKEEVWFCYPSVGSTYSDKALVYHVIDKKWSIRTLPDVGYIDSGIVEASTNSAWSNIGLTWSTANRVWNYAPYNPSSVSLLFCATSDTALHKGDTTNTANGTNIPVTIERTGNAHVSQDYIDDSAYKYVSSIWPRIDAPAGSVINIAVGVQDRIEAPITWSTYRQFTVGTDDKVDFDLSGRYWGTRFNTESDTKWKLQGHDVEVKGQGRYG